MNPSARRCTILLVADALTTELAQVFQQWNQGQPGQQAATETALRLAEESSDVRAESVAAWVLGNAGRWPEAATFAERAAVKGSAGIAQWVGSHLQGQGDPNLRRVGLRLQSAAADAGASIDFVNVAHQFANASDLEVAADAIDQLAMARPVAARGRWDELVSESEPRAREIADAAAGVMTERDRVLEAMEADRTRIAEQRVTVERLVEEVGNLANKAGGLALANDYGERANKIERRANLATVTAIVLAVLIAVLAILLAIDAGQDADPLKSALQKAPITIPFLLLNIYIARLASGFREEAINLRHIELQIRTAEPFLGALDRERRQAVLAMLALRFFPGQEVAGSGKSPSEPTDPGQAFAALLSGQSAGTPPWRTGPAEAGDAGPGPTA
jgi:hypothetical protein